MYMYKPGSNNTPDPLACMDESQLVRFWVYPVDMTLSLKLAQVKSGVGSVPYMTDAQMDAPISITQNALALWNRYSFDGQESLRAAFLMQARRLVEYEQLIGEDAGGWPLDFPPPSPHVGRHYLSALVQGQALSVLARAYILTRDTTYLEVARRAVRTFERDILDGGVSTPMAGNGLFFEQWAVYPAAHTLEGMVFALLGLHDYLALVDDIHISTLIQCAHDSLHRFLPEFETGFWTRVDLLHRQLASPTHLALQTALLEALATYSSCEHCSKLASRWKSYQLRLGSRLRYRITSCCTSFCGKLLNPMQSKLFPKVQPSHELRTCIPITAFPITGGMRAVLAKIAQVTSDIWQIEYLTQCVGPESEGFIIHQFGMARISSWLYTTVWFYCLAGFWKLISLVHHGANYRLILPQDGIFTAAFAALAAKLAGIRVVCIEHGNLTLLKSRIYHHERAQALATRNVPSRLLARLLYICYWPSLNLLARFAAHFVDHYLIPGVTGDGVEEICQQIGVHPSCITRFATMIDLDRHVLPNANLRAEIREKNSIPADAIVITIICRLAPEKGLDIALEAMSNALSTLSSEVRAQVRMIIAGDGPLRQQVEADISKCGLSDICVLWGEISSEDVISLLGLSDIFLYTSKRGACFSMAVLEAMASACAVIATTEPLSNTYLLSEGRGIALPANDAKQISISLSRLIGDPTLCRQMGALARDYIAMYHSPAAFRRTLMRVTFWSELDEFLKLDTEEER